MSSGEDEDHGNNKRRTKTLNMKAEYSDDEENAALTEEQKERACLIAERARRQNKKELYKSKALRREGHETMVNALNDELKKDGSNEKNLDLISNTMERANDAFSKIEINADGKELARDAKVIHGLSDLLLRNTSFLRCDHMKKQFSFTTFKARLEDYSEKKVKQRKKFANECDVPGQNNLLFIEKDIGYLDASDEEENNTELSKRQWKEIAINTSKIIGSLPGLAYINPLFKKVEQNAVGPTDKKVRRVRGPKEAKEEEVVISQKAREDHAKDELTVSKELDIVRKCLRRALRKNNGSISYYRFVVDPTSFGKSVENIFHTSFLIRDCVARIGLDDDGLPCIYTISEEDNLNMQRAEREGHNTVQSIFYFDHDIWKGMIDALNITDTLIHTT